MVKRFLAVMAAMAAILGPGALASEASGFSNRTVRGNYVLEVAGLVANQLDPNFSAVSTAEITVLGLVNFNGVVGKDSEIKGTLTFTASLQNTNTPGNFQQSCTSDIAPASNYAVKSDGTGTVTVLFPTSDPATPEMLVFSLIIINPGVARLVLINPDTQSLSNLTICGVPDIRSLVLIGDVTRQQQ